jgi:neutral ceramidase
VGQLRVGSARIDITPPVGSPFGCGGVEVSRGVHDPLYATSVVLDNAEREIVIVGVDVLGVDLGFTTRVSKRVLETLGISPDSVMIAASHTHTGPQGFPAVGLWFEQRVDEELRAKIGSRIVECVAMAHGAKRDVRVGFGRTFCDKVGANRRNAGGPVDPEVQVMRIDDMDGNPYTIIFNYACHPTVAHSTGLVERSLLTSADYPGATREFVEEALGLTFTDNFFACLWPWAI